MRVPVDWLHEYCPTDLSAFDLADRLAMTGTEVERVEAHGVSALEHFVVGKVVDAHQHPDADRLRVCLVDTGNGEPSQIVCGAPNVAAGQTVAVAKPGAVMPDGTKLKIAKLRGQPSNGMILAEDEVAIGTDHNGIMVLPDDIPAGTPLERVLPITTDVLVLEVTPNRPDCLGIYGVAREAHAATRAPLAPPPWASDPVSPTPAEANERAVRDLVHIVVEAPELCPRFTARAFEDVKIGPSPPWLKARLMAAGQRPISNIVDITNYVMLMTGQPLHAFDLDRIAGAQLIVRRARDGETMQTLDGQTRTLDSAMVLIADADGPTSIAGIMGGARSEVTPETTRVLMEVANWDGANVHRTSLKLGLRSEASSRNEKGLQPEQAMEAQAVAARLILDLCGARLVPGTIDIGGNGPPPMTIRLRDERVTGLLGIEIPRRRSAEILNALEFTTADAPDGLDVTVPPFRRADVTREADLIEEVARLGALQELPATLPSRHGAWGRLTGVQRLRRRAADALTAQGLHEIVGWSFEGPEMTERLRITGRPFVELENPMSADQSRLRTTLLGSLLDVGQRNRSRGTHAVRLFEAGAVYIPGGERRPGEPYHAAALLSGAVRPATWRHPDPPSADFFAAKGILGGMLDTLHADWTVRRINEPEPFLHPGRAGEVAVRGTRAGWIGEIHPQVAALWDWSDPIAAFELDLDVVASALQGHVTGYSDLTSFPEVREDLAVVVADTVGADEVLTVVRQAGGALLTDAEVFDVYRDEQRIGPGNVSLALRLQFRAPDRTLTDEEVAARRRKIAAALTTQLEGRVRDS
ncbi:MAG TPA: phenylalanine--tRNA ligase subunit beta [Solirubrobacteraceae bacterium]|nr:phenylalanine--tRNA ligase subunit beta [Solirubrobacteraceae bacterium]